MSFDADTQTLAIRNEALTWPEKARGAVVTDEPSYILTSELLKGIKALRTKIADTFDPHIQRAHAAHKALVKEKADAEAPLTEAEGIIKRTLVAWTAEQERLRLEEQRRLEAIARQREEEARLAEALAAEAAGDTDEAAALMEEAVTVQAPAVILPPASPKVAGISYREVWKFRIVDAAKVPREYLTIDETKIGGVVRALKGAANIPGVQVYSDRIASASGR